MPLGAINLKRSSKAFAPDNHNPEPYEQRLNVLAEAAPAPTHAGFRN